MHKTIDKYIFRLFALVLIIVPLVMRAKILLVASPVMRDDGMQTGIFGNVFTYYKFILLGGLFAIILGFFIYKLKSGYKIKNSYINSPLTVMALMLVLSGFLAPYTTVAMFGRYTYYEGTLTYLFYLGLFFIAANLRIDKGAFVKILYALIPIVIVNVGMGLAYFYGVDLLKFSVAKMILFPSSISENSIKLGSYISSTLFNPNYVSGIGAVLMMLFLTYACLIKDLKQKAMGIILALFAFIMIITSLSTSGFVTILLMVPVLIIAILFSSNKINGVVTLLLAIVINMGAFSVLYTHNHQIWNESIGFIVADNNNRDNLLAQGETLAKDTALASPEEAFNLPKSAWGPGTGRLYIWEKTIELIKEKPIFGYGMNTLSYFFPQDDPKINSNLNYYNTVVDKTHNMYLAIAFGSGIFSLLAFVILIFVHSYKVIRAYFGKDTDPENKIILMSLFISWAAYLVQGLFNDSFIGTAPIFWILFGVSVAYVSRDKEKQV